MTHQTTRQKRCTKCNKSFVEKGDLWPIRCATDEKCMSSWENQQTSLTFCMFHKETNGASATQTSPFSRLSCRYQKYVVSVVLLNATQDVRALTACIGACKKHGENSPGVSWIDWNHMAVGLAVVLIFWPIGVCAAKAHAQTRLSLTQDEKDERDLALWCKVKVAIIWLPNKL